MRKVLYAIVVAFIACSFVVITTGCTEANSSERQRSKKRYKKQSRLHACHVCAPFGESGADGQACIDANLAAGWEVFDAELYIVPTASGTHRCASYFFR